MDFVFFGWVWLRQFFRAWGRESFFVFLLPIKFFWYFVLSHNQVYYLIFGGDELGTPGDLVDFHFFLDFLGVHEQASLQISRLRVAHTNVCCPCSPAHFQGFLKKEIGIFSPGFALPVMFDLKRC